jgi:hypothetical protein
MVATGVAGCGVEGGIGQSSGALTLEDPETGETRAVRFDGGALTFDDALGHHLVITSWGMNFHCDYARVHVAGQAGRDIDRRRPHYELYWSDAAPTNVVVAERLEGLFGSASSGDWFELGVEVAFTDEARTTGTLSTDGGELTFEAEDCGEF